MSFLEVFESVKGEGGNSNNFYLADGINVIRVIAKPIVIQEAFVEYDVENKDTGKKEVKQRGELVYPNCGYEKAGKTKFAMYVIDSSDQLEEDGSLKIKTFIAGWKIMEGLANKEKMREAQGLGKYTFPMDLDVIINKSGSGQFNTSYSTDVMFDASKNKVKLDISQIQEALSKAPTIEEWKDNVIADTIARHEKYGKPRVRAEKKKSQDESLPVIDIAEEFTPSEVDTTKDF